MNVLILGSGGREHALCWRLAQDSSCQKVYVWPGNPGMELAKLVFLTTPFSKAQLKTYIDAYHIQLVIPGAEKFLYEGVSDWCAEWNVACFGPGLKAAELERSKLYSKKIMNEAGIPTARFHDLTEVFSSSGEMASLVYEFEKPVIKISGPSLGKGVFVCRNPQDAIETLVEIKKHPLQGIEEGIFVEEAVVGKEISLFYACNGENYFFLGAAQDHKRLLDDDKGPNTGGMGTISPVSWADQAFLDYATETFLVPTLKKMNEQNVPFKGVLFLGLMGQEKNWHLLEYNVRFGDPETQVILPLIEGDLTSKLYELCLGQKVTPPQLKKCVAVHVVKAAKGYPGTFGTVVEKGKKITSTIMPDDQSVFFFAGVKKENDQLFTDGGRVLGVTAWATSKELARSHAYAKLSELHFEGEQFRSDIGAKA